MSYFLFSFFFIWPGVWEWTLGIDLEYDYECRCSVTHWHMYINLNPKMELSRPNYFILLFGSTVSMDELWESPRYPLNRPLVESLCRSPVRPQLVVSKSTPYSVPKPLSKESQSYLSTESTTQVGNEHLSSTKSNVLDQSIFTVSRYTSGP